mmetsp:Transcript_24929/g.40374  ORF Transcript_24929/g.40374 Transcript_24929/m.40374 type:complete len:292 (+) Transcript_24929:79-954(+)|eukprot:CAMPEP_0202712072 /NCGR_PEP_ID=MMETSP1385-20130828/32768_1 /ASSEMBLY_ACC=CAM_ASM_000861 /TAXON_ID=933848 /ORGANISM="Elphidium margaritaceum" /LENGTH=291 /DNA_ID=CAMNT_0049371989 /DNA_START=72 /DNA_END=947 /DNA_ORIENTATION=+
MSEEYTTEQKAKLARHFLYVTPHGEVKDVVKDLKKVVQPSSIISDAWLNESMTEYNKRKFEIAIGDNSKVICCPQAEVAPNKYLHPEKKLVCLIDPVTQKITQESDASHLVGSGQNEEYRKAMSAKLKEYLAGFYEDGSTPNSVVKGVGSVFVSNQGQIAIVISYKNLNQSNHWTGGWQSEWTLNVSSQGNTKVEGRIRINVHYYEDGNVQLNSTFNESGDVTVSDPASTAKNVMDKIAVLETDFQKNLDEFYVKMHDSTFKKMRRFYPVTGQKLDWKARVHSLIAEAASK